MRGLKSISTLALFVVLLTVALPVVGATAAFPTGNVTIEVWWHEYGPFTAYLKQLIEEYKKLHPNVTINPTIASSTDMNQKLTVALAAGTGPDIMDADASYYVAYHANLENS